MPIDQRGQGDGTIHYNGRRILLVENGSGEKLSGDEDYPIVIFDKKTATSVGNAKIRSDGLITGFVICGMHQLTVEGESFRDFASDAYRAILESEDI